MRKIIVASLLLTTSGPTTTVEGPLTILITAGSK